MGLFPLTGIGWVVLYLVTLVTMVTVSMETGRVLLIIYFLVFSVLLNTGVTLEVNFAVLSGGSEINKKENTSLILS